jgi:predicted short-subunit dehydrogenase-like oxidoreductase (DUF2520 family)
MVRALAAAGFPIALIVDPKGTGDRMAEEMGVEVVAGVDSRLGQIARLLLLTTPDRVLAEVANTVAEKGTLRPGAALLHASATESSAVLAGEERRDDLIYLSLHPMRPFSDTEGGTDHFREVFLSIEGESSARALGHELARLLGGRAAEISPESKALYHAAGVMSATGAMALARAATIIASLLGLEEMFVPEGILPGMHAAVDIARDQGLPEGLTGPISRGDTEVVARHLAALEQSAPELVPLYREVARLNLRMAEEGGKVSGEEAARLREVLDLD